MKKSKLNVTKAMVKKLAAAGLAVAIGVSECNFMASASLPTPTSAQMTQADLDRATSRIVTFLEICERDGNAVVPSYCDAIWRLLSALPPELRRFLWPPYFFDSAFQYFYARYNGMDGSNGLMAALNDCDQLAWGCLEVRDRAHGEALAVVTRIARGLPGCTLEADSDYILFVGRLLAAAERAVLASEGQGNPVPQTAAAFTAWLLRDGGSYASSLLLFAATGRLEALDADETGGLGAEPPVLGDAERGATELSVTFISPALQSQNCPQSRFFDLDKLRRSIRWLDFGGDSK